MAKTKTITLTQADLERLDKLVSSEFASAIGPSSFLDDLKGELQRARVVDSDEVPDDIVTMNSTFTLRDLDSNETETYTLVYPHQADIANGKLSVLAPIGTAVLGQQVGDKIRWRVPDGWRHLEVVQVGFQPEQAGMVRA